MMKATKKTPYVPDKHPLSPIDFNTTENGTGKMWGRQQNYQWLDSWLPKVVNYSRRDQRRSRANQIKSLTGMRNIIS